MYQYFIKKYCVRYKRTMDCYLDSFRYEFILLGIPFAILFSYCHQNQQIYHYFIDAVFAFSLYVNVMSLIALTLMTTNVENHGVRLPAHFFFGLLSYHGITFLRALQQLHVGDELYMMYAFMNMFIIVCCYVKARKVGLHYSLPA